MRQLVVLLALVLSACASGPSLYVSPTVEGQFRDLWTIANNEVGVEWSALGFGHVDGKRVEVESIKLVPAVVSERNRNTHDIPKGTKAVAHIHSHLDNGPELPAICYPSLIDQVAYWQMYRWIQTIAVYIVVCGPNKYAYTFAPLDTVMIRHVEH